MGKKISLEDKIFVAGSTGMAGGAIYRTLRKHNYGNINNNGYIFTPNRKELNLLNKKMVEDWFDCYKPDVVILAAGKVGGIMANNTYRTEFILDNLKININILESIIKYPKIKLINLGSSCIYPLGAENPISEGSLMSGKLEPTNSPYAMAKIAAIEMGNALKVQYGHEIINLMPTNLYGPNDNFDLNNSHVIPGLMRRFHNATTNKDSHIEIWGTGKPLREFLYVDDLAEALYICMQKYDEPEIINIGTGEDVTIKELAETIIEVTGYKNDYEWDTTKPNGTPRKVLNVDKIKSLGWEPKISLKEGIKSTYEWYKENEL